jgi:hypothetical protein
LYEKFGWNQWHIYFRILDDWKISRGAFELHQPRLREFITPKEGTGVTNRNIDWMINLVGWVLRDKKHIRRIKVC